MQQIGRYIIRKNLGEGAMGQVLLAHDPSFGRDVAIKVLHRRYADDPALRKRFLREAQTLAALEHPAVVPVYDFGESGEVVWLVMRLMDGGSLADRLARGALPPAEIVLVMERIGSALDAAHARGLIHRDVKPGNILYDSYGQPYLADFGIVKLAASSSTLTMDSIIGTPAYMSPEQVRGNVPLDGRSDLYSLGVVLFEMLSGRTPYNSDTAMGTAMQHVITPIPQLSEFRSGMEGWQPLLERALAKEPGHRFQTGRELAAVVAGGVVGRPIHTPPAHSGGKRKRPKGQGQSFPLWAMGAVAAVALLLLFFFLSGSPGNQGGGSSATAPPRQENSGAVAPVNNPAVAAQPTQTATRQPVAAGSTATLAPTRTPAPTRTLVPTRTPTSTPAVSPTPTRTPTPSWHEVIEIGRSAGDIPIYADRIGSGRNAIVLVGGILSGMSPVSVELSEMMMRYFSADPSRVPANATLYIVPNLNPDAPYAPGETRGRLNANGVDLNRNWGCNWKDRSRVGGASGSAVVNGGTDPFSEPESRALRDLILDVNTRAVIFYSTRAANGMVFQGYCNGVAGGSAELSTLYRRNSNYPPPTTAVTTGEGESVDWIASRGIPSIFVLMRNHTDLQSGEWDRNRNAVIAVLESYGR